MSQLCTSSNQIYTLCRARHFHYFQTVRMRRTITQFTTQPSHTMPSFSSQVSHGTPNSSRPLVQFQNSKPGRTNHILQSCTTQPKSPLSDSSTRYAQGFIENLKCSVHPYTRKPVPAAGSHWAACKPEPQSHRTGTLNWEWLQLRDFRASLNLHHGQPNPPRQFHQFQNRAIATTHNPEKSQVD